MALTRLLFFTILCSLGSARVRNDDFDAYNTRYWNNWAANLNRDIRQNVDSSLSGLDNLGSRISEQVQRDLSGLNNLGATITQRVRESTDGLDNLGQSISQQVYAGLKPVREMQAKLRVRFGQGGTTIATFKDKQLLLRNGVAYECNGTISEADGSCSGTLSRPSFNDKKDFCYANVNSVINNWYCISNGGGVNSGYINGKVYCNGINNEPTLLISAEEYRKLCGDNIYPVTYKYFGTQPIGEHSSDIQCTVGTPYTCTYTENQSPNLSSTSSIYVSN